MKTRTTSGRTFIAGIAIMATVAASCANNSHHAGPPASSAGSGTPPASDSATPPDLHTTIQYSGSYDEKINYQIVGPVPSAVKAVARHIHFSFRESVSLTTPGSSLVGPSLGPGIDSSTNPLTFQMSGTMSEQDTPPNSYDCTATVSGVGGVHNWGAGNMPPVEITIVPNPDKSSPTTTGSPSDRYQIQVVALVPSQGANSGIINVNITSGQDASNFCKQPGASELLMVKDPKCTDFQWAGNNEPPFLDLPLDTQNYSKSTTCDLTDPINTPATANGDGMVGTDVVSGGGTLTVNAKGAAYVALGDSFSSGDFPPFQDDKCERSTQAYPEIYDSKVDFLACLGYTSGQIRDLQVPNIPANAKVVSVTAGGDDVHLIGIVSACIFRQWIAAPGKCRPDPTLPQQLAGEASGLASMFSAIQAQAPNAKIYILGYPDPLPKTFTPGNCPALEQVIAPGIQTGIVNQDLDYLNSVNDQINAVDQSAAMAAGATYIAPDPSFAQHNACSADTWFLPLSLQNPFEQALHPNVAGQRELEQELFTAAGPAPD